MVYVNYNYCSDILHVIKKLIETQFLFMCEKDHIKYNEIDGTLSIYGDYEVCKILVENPERERLLGRPSHRLKDNIEVYPRKWDVEQTQLIQHRIG
jgi:hypothetical protein